MVTRDAIIKANVATYFFTGTRITTNKIIAKMTFICLKSYDISISLSAS